jgi:hypothetical protein
MEDEGVIPDRLRASVPAVCRSLIGTATELVGGLDELDLGIVDDLQLLTLGPQLRGSRNTVLGKNATLEVFNLVKSLLEPYVRKETGSREFELVNASERTVSVSFGTDPDVCITEKLKSGDRPLLAVEIKGGTGYSNVHNRLGEAEKSHLRARRSKGLSDEHSIFLPRQDQASGHPRTQAVSRSTRLVAGRTALGDESPPLLMPVIWPRHRKRTHISSLITQSVSPSDPFRPGAGSASSPCRQRLSRR